MTSQPTHSAPATPASTISVIIPVYNAEDTLERCVGSLLAQTHADLDVILVDDGSTDISCAMCDAYAEFDARVRVFHTPNRGLSAARNLGIDSALAAGTRFIAFANRIPTSAGATPPHHRRTVERPSTHRATVIGGAWNRYRSSASYAGANNTPER